MPISMPARPKGRTVSALLVAGALVVSAGVGGATAGALITGRDIQDKSITAADIANRTIETRQLSNDAVASLKTRWNSGVGAPTEEGSVTGDWYLDTATGDAYKNTPTGWELRVNIMGATGAPGAVGPQGATGARGETGAVGAKGDAGATGAKGDTGDTGATGATGDAGAQGVTGAKGDTGEAGSEWLQGTTLPATGTGVVGDWYLNTATFDAYEKSAGGWTLVVNLRGPIGPKGDTGAQGLQGTKGDTGSTGGQGIQGLKGDTGSTGGQGIQGLKGDKGDQGIQGIQGIQGPQGPAGGGATLRDGNDASLGKVVSMDRSGVSFVTSTGYLFTATWNGVVSPGQVYYTSACATPASGQAYLNDGGGSSNPGNRFMLGKFGVFSRSLDTWMVPTTVTQGYSTSVSFQAIGFDNPACADITTNTRGGWLLRSASTAELGLPASGSTVNQFALPLSAS